MSDQGALAATATPAPPSLLLVDDEANILSSLRRLFRPFDYRVLTASSGPEALALLAEHPVDLVISDMRMPEMSGAQLLAAIRAQWPETIRILLTGYADMSSTVEAINQGEIYRYIAKPWDDNDVLMIVRQALEMKALAGEKRRLEQLTQQQNEALNLLNASLEQKVLARTQELEQTMSFLEQANDKLKKSFITSVKVFANLIELREGSIAGHSRRVADLSRLIAIELKLSNNDVQEIFLAGLLHDIGKIGLSDTILKKPQYSLSADEREQMNKHPGKGETALMALEQLQAPARLIRHHHERFDGLGYPDNLTAAEIPTGAMILAVSNDFDSLQSGTLQPKRFTREEAIHSIKQGTGKRYAPQVVDAFLAVLTRSQNSGNELELKSSQLEVGMVIARDLVTRDGILLLARDYVLDARIIGKIRHFEQTEGRAMTIHINAPARK